jgi:SAM-dependent methyltransferase
VTVPEERETWHHGLVARWWAEFNVASDEELTFYRAAIERYGQPALDLGCGTGRMLVPLAASGLDVDGCDVSDDMLAYCRSKAASAGLTPQLFQQSGDELALPRKYGTIYICDSFGTVGSLAALERIHEHLAPGGALVFNTSLPFEDAERWPYWLPDGRRGLPEPWPPEAMARKRAANGEEISLRSRTIGFDPLEQLATREIEATLWRDGRAVTTEVHTLHTRTFFRNELLVMLSHAGFSAVTVAGGYDGRPVSADNVHLVFTARK